MKFRKFKKIGKKLYGKHHFYAKIIYNEDKIPENIVNANIPGYCFICIRNSNKMIVYKNL